MRLLINHSVDDKGYLTNLIPLLKEKGLTGVASHRDYDITTLQQAATKGTADAILCSNQATLQKLVGNEKATLDAYRGSRFNFPIPVIVVNPLAHIHSVDYGKWLLKQDLAKFRHLKRKPVPFSFTPLETHRDFEDAYAFAAECIIISHDVETDDYLQITCISFTCLHSSGETKVFVVPFVDFDRVHFTQPSDLALALIFMQRMMALPATKLAFNGLYDSQYEIRYRAWPINWTLDAMILGWSEFAELPRSLDFQASLNCYDYIFWKQESEQSKKAKDIMSYWAYCGKDSWYTLRVFLKQISRLKDYTLHNYRKTFRQVYPDLYIGFEGVKVDIEAREKAKVAAEIRASKLLGEIRTITAKPDFNPGSWQQVSHFLYNVIGAKKPQMKKGAGTDSKALNRVAVQHPLVALITDRIIKYREESKALSNYYSFDLMNGRLLYNQDPSGTETGRKASKASAFWCGAQIQNMPSYAKEFLIADEGYVLIERDNNKSEARCVAYLSRAEAMIRALEDLDKDFYKSAAVLFGLAPTYEEVTKEMRNDITKHVIHGTHYVMGPEPMIDRITPLKMYAIIKMTGYKGRNLANFAKYLLSLYHNMNPELRKNMWKEVMDELQINGRLVSPTGWTRIFFGDPRKHHSVFRAAVAHAPQNLSVELVNDDYYTAYRDLVVPSNGEFRLKAQIHDSIFAQAIESKAMYYAERLNAINPGEVKIHGRSMILPTDTKMGKIWAKMEEVSFK